MRYDRRLVVSVGNVEFARFVFPIQASKAVVVQEEEERCCIVSVLSPVLVVQVAKDVVELFDGRRLLGLREKAAQLMYKRLRVSLDALVDVDECGVDVRGDDLGAREQATLAVLERSKDMQKDAAAAQERLVVPAKVARDVLV